MPYLASENVQPIEAPVQRPQPQFGPGLELPEVDRLVRATRARAEFRVDGAGTVVAVLDTGLRTTHVDFAGRVAAQQNFTGDNSGDPGNASDGNGHGTNVSGIICAGADHVGIAPGAGVIPINGIENDNGESVQQGTSQATPVVSGVTLLLQEFHLRATGELPRVSDLAGWLRRSAKTIHDGDDENDNVRHTNQDYRRVDAQAALSLLKRDLEIQTLASGS